MKQFFLSLLFFVATLSTLPHSTARYPGTNLRGKIVTLDPYNRKQVALQNAVVALYTYNVATKQWLLVSQTITNPFGFYFFYSIQPGKYFIQVNKAKNYQINVVEIDYRTSSFQDLPILYF